MALPNSDLQFTIKIKKAAFEKATKDLGILQRELEKAVYKQTKRRRSASFQAHKNNSKQAFNTIQKKADKVFKGLDNATESAVASVLETIKLDSINITPIDTGDTRASAYVYTETSARLVQGRVGYNITSGPVPAGVKTGVDHAILVHELDQNYRVGQWKFFQTAVEQNISDIPGQLKSKITISGILV